MVSDKEYQTRNLERILDDATLSPIFKQNPKFPDDGVPRIAFSDVMNRKLIIRMDRNVSGNAFWNEGAEVLVEYNSIEELIGDGWRLD